MIAVDLAPLTELVQMAVQVRPSEPYVVNPLGARPEEIELAQRLLEHVPDCTSSSLTDSIALLVQELAGTYPKQLEVLKPGIVFASRPQKIVVKVFPLKGKEGHYRFVREISGQKALADLDLSSGKVVEILGAGKCLLNGETCFLLAMRLMPGEEIRKSLDAIFISDDREDALTNCQHILRRLGETLAEIHTAKAVTFTVSPELASFARRDIAAKIDKYYTRYVQNGGVFASELAALFEQKLAEPGTTLTVAAGHGDTHLMNFLYDPATGKIVVLDTTRAHLTLDPEGAPLGPVHIHDVTRTLYDIVKAVLYHEENYPLIETLTDAFNAGYLSKAPHLISPSDLDLGLSVMFLSHLAGPEQNDPPKSSEELLVKKRISSYYFSQIVNLKD